MTTEEWNDIFPITKKQIVYITTNKKNTWYKIQSPIDADGLSMSANAIKQEGYFFTEEQLKQLLSDYTNKIIENAKVTSSEGIDIENVSIDKESITNQLELFLKDLL